MADGVGETFAATVPAQRGAGARGIPAPGNGRATLGTGASVGELVAEDVEAAPFDQGEVAVGAPGVFPAAGEAGAGSGRKGSVSDDVAVGSGA